MNRTIPAASDAGLIELNYGLGLFAEDIAKAERDADLHAERYMIEGYQHQADAWAATYKDLHNRARTDASRRAHRRRMYMAEGLATAAREALARIDRHHDKQDARAAAAAEWAANLEELAEQGAGYDYPRID